ncbi:ATP-binding cassette domain-containing protein [Thiohalobacter sp. IOR34]|uniref:ABC transporter ATP-binding protein n=1 Tax=Thiohalobacter sp. IOR34 TaxID=3057176 RepID=UPI0025B0988A|nr:ATP-binding cassette domain-containing protein [Thiohalobacter sp. IOR34]WJW76250.1 ATP-binding cassette domain-containing protein [Thiohalobacter sp. IOR34]
MPEEADILVELRDVTTRFGDHVVHQGLNLEVRRGEILALVGGSGSGKTTLLQEMIMLRRPSSGSIRLFGEELTAASSARALALRRRFGVLFQHGALFSGLSVLQNVAVPLREHTRFGEDFIEQIALLKIRLAGLPPEAAGLYPSELSGGMIKRAGLARAMVLDPQLLFLDEPTSGLDPASADAFDALVRRLQQWLGLTLVMITHDPVSLWNLADRVAVLGEGRIVAVGPMAELEDVAHPAVQEYFQGERARRARQG